MVDKQNSQGSIDRQYLIAMGIDLWVDRNSVMASAETTPAVNASSVSTSVSEPASATGSKAAHKQLADLSARELATSVADLEVNCSEAVRPAELLVITEGLSLSAECMKLLESMFKAIEFDRSQWLHAGISDVRSEAGSEAGSEAISRAGDAIALSQLHSTVRPKALVVMINAGGNPTALQSVRGLQHKVTALNGFMVASFHPQDLLDNPETKRPAWEDLKQLRQWLT